MTEEIGAAGVAEIAEFVKLLLKINNGRTQICGSNSTVGQWQQSNRARKHRCVGFA